MELNGKQVNFKYFNSENLNTHQVRIQIEFLDGTTAELDDMVTLPSGERRKIDRTTDNRGVYLLSMETY